jgi:hypothetical protein
MKADSFAKLVVLEALIEAEIGYYLEHRPASLELFREAMVSRISDLIDEIDVLDAAAAARLYDAIVDFLAELPEDEEGIVEATIHFRRAVDRVVDRGMDRRDLGAAATWAVVLDELLAELADEYHGAVLPGGSVRPREFLRVQALLARVRMAGDRMLWTAGETRDEIRSEVDRLALSVRHRRVPPVEVDLAMRSLQRRIGRFRPSTLTRIGGFIVRQVLRREAGRGEGKRGGQAGAGQGRPSGESARGWPPRGR